MFAQSQLFDLLTSNQSTICVMSQISRTYLHFSSYCKFAISEECCTLMWQCLCPWLENLSTSFRTHLLTLRHTSFDLEAQLLWPCDTISFDAHRNDLLTLKHKSFDLETRICWPWDTIFFDLARQIFWPWNTISFDLETRIFWPWDTIFFDLARQIFWPWDTIPFDLETKRI